MSNCWTAYLESYLPTEAENKIIDEILELLNKNGLTFHRSMSLKQLGFIEVTMKKTGQSKPKHPKQAPPRSWQERFRTARKIVAVIVSLPLTALAAIGYYYQYGPQISATRSGSLNPTDPFATEFTVKNESLLTVSRIRADCSLNNIEFTPPLTPPMKVQQIVGVSTDNMSKLLSRGESMAIICLSNGFKFRDRKLIKGELLIEVSFQYLVLSKTINLSMKQLFKFDGRMGADGNLQWMRQPLDKGSVRERSL